MCGTAIVKNKIHHRNSGRHVRYYPTYAVIDRKGALRVIGPQPQQVEAVVQKLLAKPAPASVCGIETGPEFQYA